jgi:hypothetical protein
MKIINIKGGLGNQMFQYAYGRALEIKGKGVIFSTFLVNDGRAKIDTARDFKLDKFNLKTRAQFVNKKFLLSDFLNRVLNRLNFKENGFWQSEKFFKEITENIHQEFTLKNPVTIASATWQKKIQGIENSVSLHIRRGDYVLDKTTNAFHGTCNLEYYQKALAEISNKLKDKNIEIFIFSDDIAWAKTNLSFPHPIHFVSDPQIPDYEEMYLMSLCKHNIIANSTFSWWGAWLNKNPDKIVVAPKQWFAHKTADELDILSPGWLKI